MHRLLYIPAVVVLLGSLAGCDSVMPPAQPKNLLEIEQAKAAAAQANANAQIQKRIFDLQVKVIEACIARNGVPVLSNANVDCRITH